MPPFERIARAEVREGEWLRAPLGDVAAKIQDGTHFSPTTSEGPYRYITSRNVRFGYLDTQRTGWISEREHRLINARCDVREGDVLLTKDGANTGNAALNTLTEEVSLLSSVAFIRPDENRLSAPYLLHYLLSQEGQKRLQDLMAGNAITRLTLAKIRAFDVPVPSLDEQRAIASVLDAADAAMRHTEQALIKLQRVSEGLLHDLLTRGLDEGGRPRDPRRNPDDFSQTPLGLLPRNWKILPVATLVDGSDTFVQTGPFGSQLHASDYVSAGVPVVMPQHIRDGVIDGARVARISEAKARALGRHRMRPGDVVFSRRGDLSKCAPITESEDGWLCGTGCLLLRPPQEAVQSSWLAAMYRHDSSQRQVMAMAVGSTMVNLNTTLLGALQIPLPPRAEQEQICAVLKASRKCADALGEELRKLRLIKRGLSRDLLTGRIRAPLPAEGSPNRARVSA